MDLLPVLMVFPFADIMRTADSSDDVMSAYLWRVQQLLSFLSIEYIIIVEANPLCSVQKFVINYKIPKKL